MLVYLLYILRIYSFICHDYNVIEFIYWITDLL